ncbi:unnamed protein product [Pleuronectes platessa]|uniref:Uncharacterized protein n=1 Tax=Pleuronectes platessa TaxID=8262 RepID=A0A9N7W0B3_PLEPL|nr:unnamed protein product [Pleuronectes platessa]
MSTPDAIPLAPDAGRLSPTLYRIRHLDEPSVSAKNHHGCPPVPRNHRPDNRNTISPLCTTEAIASAPAAAAGPLTPTDRAPALLPPGVPFSYAAASHASSENAYPTSLMTTSTYARVDAATLPAVHKKKNPH